MMKALVVYGQPDDRRAIVEVLSQLEGVAVLGAMSDLETTARVLTKLTPDLLVIGTQLADGDGIRIIEQVRRRGMAIVVVGPAPSRDVWLRYLEAGADRFVEPDPELEELQFVVRALVERPVRAHPEALMRAADRGASRIVHDFSNYLHAIEVALEMLERSPGDKQLWEEARVALDQATCLTTMLLGHVQGDQL